MSSIHEVERIHQAVSIKRRLRMAGLPNVFVACGVADKLTDDDLRDAEEFLAKLPAARPKYTDDELRRMGRLVDIMARLRRAGVPMIFLTGDVAHIATDEDVDSLERVADVLEQVQID